MFAVQAATDNTTHLKNTEILVEKTLLELGVGEMTPGVIKLPFWSMTEMNSCPLTDCPRNLLCSVPLNVLDSPGVFPGD